MVRSSWWFFICVLTDYWKFQTCKPACRNTCTVANNVYICVLYTRSHQTMNEMKRKRCKNIYKHIKCSNIIIILYCTFCVACNCIECTKIKQEIHTFNGWLCFHVRVSVFRRRPATWAWVAATAKRRSSFGRPAIRAKCEKYYPFSASTIYIKCIRCQRYDIIQYIDINTMVFMYFGHNLSNTCTFDRVHFQ